MFDVDGAAGVQLLLQPHETVRLPFKYLTLEPPKRAKAAGKGAAAAAAGSSKATTGGKRKLQQTTLDVGGS